MKATTLVGQRYVVIGLRLAQVLLVVSLSPGQQQCNGRLIIVNIEVIRCWHPHSARIQSYIVAETA